jgi:hypothetical protein
MPLVVIGMSGDSHAVPPGFDVRYHTRTPMPIPAAVTPPMMATFPAAEGFFFWGRGRSTGLTRSFGDFLGGTICYPSHLLAVQVRPDAHWTVDSVTVGRVTDAV